MKISSEHDTNYSLDFHPTIFNGLKYHTDIETLRMKWNIYSMITMKHLHEKLVKHVLTLSPPNKLLFAKFLVWFNFPSASIFKVLQCPSKFVKMLSECQTAWILIRWSASHPYPSHLHMEILLWLEGNPLFVCHCMLGHKMVSL